MGRKKFSPNTKNYSNISLGSSETNKVVCQDSLIPDWVWARGPTGKNQEY
jgi:hypothetical protein